jgi:hypothetical protein
MKAGKRLFGRRPGQGHPSRSLQRPWRLLRPVSHRVSCPRSRLVLVARSTSVRYLILLRHRWRNEVESVCAHEGAGDPFSLNLRHMARYALTSRAAVAVVGVFLHGSHMGTIWRWPHHHFRPARRARRSTGSTGRHQQFRRGCRERLVSGVMIDFWSTLRWTTGWSRFAWGAKAGLTPSASRM